MLKPFLAQRQHNKSSRYSILPQLVILLSLTPFIFSLNLYDIRPSHNIASKYQIAPDRFDGMSYEALTSSSLKKPTKPKVRISKKQRAQITALIKKSPEQLCLANIRAPKAFDIAGLLVYQLRTAIEPQCKKYRRDLSAYKRALSDYNQKARKNRAEQRRLQAQADNFISSNHIKPAAPAAEVIETSSQTIGQLLHQLELSSDDFQLYDAETFENNADDTDYSEAQADSNENAQLPDNNTEGSDPRELTEASDSLWQLISDKATAASSFQLLCFIPWLLTFLLLIPAWIISIKQRAWDAALFGLAWPTVSYGLYILSPFVNIGGLAGTTPAAVLFAQIAFGWFLIRGKVLSKSFVVFLLILFISSFLPALTGSINATDVNASDSTDITHQGYSVMKAQIPLVIFIIISLVGCLIVKGARENVGLLKQLGWAHNLKSASHAFLLWIPMGLLCLPFFYLTKVTIPTTVTNELHANNILRYDSSHQAGFLDNTLQSIAHMTDDINFVWHLTIEERKAYLFSANQTLQNTAFEQTVTKHFDNIVPADLAFEKANSNAPLIGWLVNIATQETQKTIRKTYQGLRSSIKDNLANLVREQEAAIKLKAKQSKDAAMEKIDQLKADGKQIIINQSNSTQTGLWWTMTYLQAAHQLALLLFVFICLKSYLYVFSRVSFHKDKGATVTLAEASSANTTTPAPSSLTGIKATGIEYAIDCSKPASYYISRRYQCRGKPPKLSIPQPLSASLARLWSKAFTMNQLQINSDDSDITCTATKGIEFFEWDLQAGETVIFDFDNFVGMTGELKLSTLISPKISSLLLGKFIYSQATGPGKLILMATGRAKVCSATDNIGSLPPERIIAMQDDTQLHVDSELDIINVYLSTAYVKPIEGLMIVDVDNQAGARNGLARFVKNFILPG